MSVHRVRRGIFVATGCIAFPAWAGITVTSYQTGAGTNAFAPLSKAEYFQQQVVANTSPATADASGDWTGTNVGGSDVTWHWLGSAHASSTTNVDPSSIHITAAGNFDWDISTTSGFYDPNRVAVLYVPGASTGYQCYFTVDAPATYTILATLNRNSGVSLASIAAGDVFQRFNFGSNSLSINTSGVLPPGDYQIAVSSSSVGLDFIQGVNHEVQAGSYSDFLFSIEVPEPSAVPMVMVVLISSMRKRRHN